MPRGYPRADAPPLRCSFHGAAGAATSRACQRALLAAAADASAACAAAGEEVMRGSDAAYHTERSSQELVS